MKLLIKGATILTMRHDAPFTGDILIDGSRIADIQPAIRDAGADEVIHAEGMAAMPGLINAHQHTPMSLLRGFSDDLKLMDWLEKKMFPAEARMTPEDIYWGAKLAMAEMIRSGTTAFADMYIHMNEIAAAVEETGMRASLTRGLVFTEDDGGRRMAEALDLIKRWSGKAEGRITTMLGPHSPYTVPPELWREVIRLAEQEDIPIHTHLAETVEEVALIRERYKNGMSRPRQADDIPQANVRHHTSVKTPSSSPAPPSAARPPRGTAASGRSRARAETSGCPGGRRRPSGR